MKREIEPEFHENIKGKIIESLSYSWIGKENQVTYVSIHFKDGTTLGVGLDCTPTHHSMGFHIERWNQIADPDQNEKL